MQGAAGRRSADPQIEILAAKGKPNLILRQAASGAASYAALDCAHTGYSAEEEFLRLQSFDAVASFAAFSNSNFLAAFAHFVFQLGDEGIQLLLAVELRVVSSCSVRSAYSALRI